MTFTEFLHSKIGSNWCVARRTRRIVERYGADVVALTPNSYHELELEWRAQYAEKQIAEDLVSAMIGPTSGGIARQVAPAIVRAIINGSIRHVKAFN